MHAKLREKLNKTKKSIMNSTVFLFNIKQDFCTTICHFIEYEIKKKTKQNNTMIWEI